MTTYLIHLLEKELSLNDLGALHYFIGKEVIYRDNGLLLNQTRYATDLLEQEFMRDCKLISTPLHPNHYLNKTDDTFALPNVVAYRLIVRALQYSPVPNQTSHMLLN